MPLALDMALVGRLLNPGEMPSFGHSNASHELVGKINRGAVRQCHSRVYAHEETEELRLFVKKNYVQDDSLFGGRFTNNPEPTDPERAKRLITTLRRLAKSE